MIWNKIRILCFLDNKTIYTHNRFCSTDECGPASRRYDVWMVTVGSQSYVTCLANFLLVYYLAAL